MQDARRWLGCFGVAVTLTVGLAGCDAYRPITDAQSVRYQGLGRLATLQEFRIAYETSQSVCQLERADGEQPPARGWRAIDPSTVLGAKYRVIDRKVHAAGTKVDFVALRVEDNAGAKMWIRNAPTADMVKASRAWRCAVDLGWIRERLPKKSAKVVTLSATTAQCPAIIPIAGGPDDVTFSPYTVAGLGVFAGAPALPQKALAGEQGMIGVGVRLEAEGGERMLTVPTAVYDRCFVPASKTPPPPAEAKALVDWLTGSDPDATAPPAVSLETIETVTGLDVKQCLKEGSGTTEHLECRRPLLRIARMPGDGPFGPSILQLTRERFVDAVHIYGGKLISGAEVINVNAVVRLPRLEEKSTFARVFGDTLRASLKNPAKQMARGQRGFRLLSTADVSPAVAATHFVEVDLNFRVPDLETSMERRKHRYIAGKKMVHNKEHDKAKQAVDDARNDVSSKENNLRLAKAALEEAQACQRAADQLGGLAKLAAGAACAVVSGAAIGSAEGAVNSAKERLRNAEAKLGKTPSEVEVDDDREWEYEAKILRRRGEAQAKLSIVSASDRARSAQFAATMSVPFDASDVEIPNDPEHKLTGKQANPPTVEAAERALAEALVPRIDEAIIKWGAQRQVGGDIGDLRPGTRSWMVAVARRAASDRPIKLLSDLLENRPDLLKKRELVYPVKLPEGSDAKCFVFAAIATGNPVDVNLELGRASGVRFMALGRDVRRDPDAAFEVCGMPPGDYSVRATIPEAQYPDGVLISLFDATPGGPTNADTMASARGLPTMPRKGQEMALYGEGQTRYSGTAGKVVVGKTGDRDGDGVPDDDDRCPYDPETKNGYLDEDGCPDEVPAGWKPPAAAPAPAPAPAAAPASSAAPPDKKKPEPAPAEPAEGKDKKTDKKTDKKNKPPPSVYVP
jgi:hypothetical protein